MSRDHESYHLQANYASLSLALEFNFCLELFLNNPISNNSPYFYFKRGEKNNKQTSKPKPTPQRAFCCLLFTYESETHHKSDQKLFILVEQMENLFASVLEFCNNNWFEISIALLVVFLVYIFLYVIQIHELIGNITRAGFHSNICSEQSDLLSTLLHPLKVDQLNTDRLLDILDISGINCPFEHLPTGCQLTCWEPNPYGQPFLEKKAADSERVFLKEVLGGPIGDLDKLEDGSFDTVVSHMALCSISDPEEVLAEIHRLLRPVSIFFLF